MGEQNNQEYQATAKPLYYIGIAASAGGLEAAAVREVLLSGSLLEREVRTDFLPIFRRLATAGEPTHDPHH